MIIFWTVPIKFEVPSFFMLSLTRGVTPPSSPCPMDIVWFLMPAGVVGNSKLARL